MARERTYFYVDRIIDNGIEGSRFFASEEDDFAPACDDRILPFKILLDILLDIHPNDMQGLEENPQKVRKKP